MLKSLLSIKDISLQCRLGCFLGEQERPQEVRISLFIYKEDLPQACFTDQLEDTICYSVVCNEIKKVVLKKSYSTIEKLTWSIFSQLKEDVLRNFQLKLVVCKIRPPLQEILGGAEFQISELPL